VHATELETAKAAVRAGSDILVHSVFDRPVDEDFVEMVRERGVIYSTTIVVLEGYAEVLGQRGSKQPRRNEMATIGTFKKSGNELQGEIVTLSVQAKGVRIVPETQPDQRQRAEPSGLCRPRRDWRRVVEALQRGPRLSLGQARRSELHHADLRQPVR
jgi:hypothetical protein